MIALQHQETIEGSSEASLKCLGKGFPCSMLKEGFAEFKEQTHSQKISHFIKPQKSLCEAIINNPNEFHNKPKHDFGAWSPFHPKSQKVQQCQMNASEGQFRRVPFTMLPQGYSNDFQTQEFEYFVVIDFEATCDKEKIPHPQEIIEFPSVIVSTRTGQLEACFQTYVKPTCNQHLSAFCKDLTGIQQNQVDRGVTLGEALLRHDKWLEKRGIKNTNFVVVTWSNWDCRVMLESECRFKKIRKPPYFNRWINLKVPFNEFFGGVRCNLKEAVQLAGLVWQGRPHCGLDDAKNTARLLAFLMHRGFRFSITNSLIWQTSNYPLTLNHYQEAHMSQIPDKPNNLHIFPYQFHHPLCLCGVQSSKVMVRKPGPKYGSMFFGCGNWTAARGALCHYFEWAHGRS